MDVGVRGRLRAAAVLLLIGGLAACADPAGSGSPPSDASDVVLPAQPGALVLRVEYVGGFMTPETNLSRLPSFSLYADGRLITNGPVAAIYPGFALPNLQVQTLDEAMVRELADRALAAGVAESTDLGSPNVADVPSTRITLVTADDTHVREVYALAEYVFEGDRSETDLTDEQRAGRAELRDLLTALGNLGQQLTPDGQVPVEPYVAESVAAIVRPWSAPEEDIAQGLAPDPVPWPGPPLPGEPAGGLPELSCVTATGAAAAAVLAAAGDANMLTPWSTPDGAVWSVAFRPLLPDESGCADLLD